MRKKNEKCIGYCGRIGLEKHLEDIIHLAKKFNGEILIAGEGPARKDYEELANKINANNVKFLGKIPHEELPKFYSKLDFLFFLLLLKHRDWLHWRQWHAEHL